MTRKMVFISVLLASLSQVSCATWEKETLAYMGAGLATGAAAGALQAPAGDSKAMHGVLWGGLTAAAVGATLIALKDDDAMMREKDIEIEKLRIELSAQDKFKFHMSSGSIVDEELPDEINNLIQPGHWKIFEIDKWKKTSRGRFTHEDKILEYKAPKVKIKR